MTFFTHDQAIKAITFQHPVLVHGKDYMVIMEIEPGRANPSIPKGDAIIQWWDATEPQPSITDLKSVYSANNLNSWKPPES